jgi:hypothetical protein
MLQDRHPDADSEVIFPDQWHGRPATPSTELPAVTKSGEEKVGTDHRFGNVLDHLEVSVVDVLFTV